LCGGSVAGKLGIAANASTGQVLTAFVCANSEFPSDAALDAVFQAMIESLTPETARARSMSRAQS